MLKTSPIAVFGAVMTIGLSGLAYSPVNAGAPQDRPETDMDGRPIPQDGERRSNRRNRNSTPAPAAATPEQNIAAAQALATAASASCQVSEATLLGVNAEGNTAYEAACGSGPGYVFIGTTPPTAVDCVELVSAAALTRERDPAADVGIECKLPANTNILPVIAGYAQSAGVACTIDEALGTGRATDTGGLIYEVGCAGQDGYTLREANGAWTKTECLQLASQNVTCRFTTTAEQSATVKGWLAGSDAAACDVQQSRWMGSNANGTFYEAKCAGGDGYIARLNDAKAVQQIYPCATAQQIGGGCTLTVVAAAPAAPAPAATPATPE